MDDLEDKNRELMLQFEALADQVRSLDPTGSVSDPVQVSVGRIAKTASFALFVVFSSTNVSVMDGLPRYCET